MGRKEDDLNVMAFVPVPRGSDNGLLIPTLLPASHIHPKPPRILNANQSGLDHVIFNSATKKPIGPLYNMSSHVNDSFTELGMSVRPPSFDCMYGAVRMTR